MLGGITRKPAPDARVNKMREYEEKLQALNLNVKDTKVKEAAAVWEVKTDGVIQRNQAKRRLDELRAFRARTLDDRRSKLALKLQQDDAALQRELETTKESPEERRSKLAARARQLQEAREARRQAEADRLLFRALREACDPLRTLDSQNRLMYAHNDRQRQIDEKNALEAQKREEDARYARLWEEDRLKKEARYQRDLEEERVRNEAQLRILEQQVAAVEAKRADERSEREQEAIRIKAAYEAEDRRLEALEVSERERKARMAVEIKRFNAEKIARDRKAEDEDKAHDSRLLAEALAREREAEQREQDLKALRREQTREYRRHMEALMIKEREDTAEQDRLVAEYAAEQQRREDAMRAAQDAARAQLMREVHLSRQEQLAMQEAARKREADERVLERLEQEQQSAELARLEEENKHRKLLGKVGHQLDIQAQIFAKEQKRLAEEEERRVAFERAQAAERQYTAFVHQAATSDSLARWHGRKKLDWFD